MEASSFCFLLGCHMRAESQEVIILKWVFVRGMNWAKVMDGFTQSCSRLEESFRAVSGPLLRSKCIHPSIVSPVHSFNLPFAHSFTYSGIYPIVTERLAAPCQALCLALEIKWGTRPRLAQPDGWTEQ